MKFNFKKTYYRVFSLVLAIVMFMISLPLAALAINDTSSSGFEENIVHITEITDRREENVKHFDMGDGTYTAISYGTAVHRKDENGEWQDINNNLSLTTVQSKEIYATSDMRTSFAKQFTPNSQLVTLAENGYSVSMGILQSASNGSINADATAQYVPSAPSEITNAPARASSWTNIDDAAIVDNVSSIVYNNIKSGVDLEYILDGSDIKENIIVKSVQSSYVYDFQLILSGLVAILNDDGSISLSDIDDGTAKYTIPAPYMYDANGEISYSVTYSLFEVKPELYILTVDANDEWINDSDRIFPVTIDPSILLNPIADQEIWDTYTDLDSTTTNELAENLLVGYRKKAYYKFNLPTIPTGAITSQVQFKITYSFAEPYENESIELELMRILANWQENLSNTATLAMESFPNNSLTLVGAITTGTISTFIDITNLANIWYSEPTANFGFAIQRTGGTIEEISFKSSESSDERHRPYVRVTYYQAFDDGIYMFQNVANSKMYMDVRNNSISAGAYVQQLRYLSRTTPKTEQSASGLFELTYKESTDSYIIRCLTNRELTFGFGETIYGTNPISPLVTKEISLNDSSVLAEDTFKIEYYGGFVIHEYSSSRIISAQDTVSSGDEAGNDSLLTSTTVSTVSDLSRWKITKCSEDDVGPFASFNITGEVLAGKTATFTPFVSVGGDEYEITNITTSNLDGIATFISESSDGSLTYKFHDEGTIYFNVTVSNGLRSITLDPMAYDVKLPFAEGNYVIKNKAISNYLYDVLLSGNIVIANNFTDACGDYYPHCWVITHVIDGYYLIKSFEEEGYLTAPSPYDGYVTSEFLSEELSDRQLWILDEDVPTIKAKLYEDLNHVIQVVMDSYSCAVYNMSYSSDSNYMDEWVFIKTMETSGYELDYDPSLWDGEVETTTNCYAYAIDNQILFVEHHNPGLYAGLGIGGLFYSPPYDQWFANIREDFEQFGIDTNRELICMPIGRDTACPAGTYKIALVLDIVDENPDNDKNDKDCHFYRQDSDGLWSHKQGNATIQKTDESGKPIIDPETADRGRYTVFVGYYAITPWSTYQE